MTPATPRTCAPMDRFPPHDAASRPVCCSTTMISPGEAASIAAVHRCACIRPAFGAIELHRENSPGDSPVGREAAKPVTEPFNPNLSRASETAQESRRLRRKIKSSMFVSVELVPVHERHSVSGARFRPVTGNIIYLRITPSFRVHRGDHREPVLDFGRAHFEHILRQLQERLFVAFLIAVRTF